MLKRQGVTLILRLVLVAAILASVLAFTIQPALAATSVAEQRSPAPDNFIFGGGIESFWARVTFENQPAVLEHRISSALGGAAFDPNNVIHTHVWTFPGSPVSANGTFNGHPISGVIPDTTSPVYNPEIYTGGGSDAELETRYQTADPNHAHVVVIPPGTPAGTYVSRFDYYRIGPGPDGTLGTADDVATFDSAAEVTFLVAEGITIFKYNDLNGNGVQDANEPGLDNWSFTITGPENSIINPTTNATVTTLTGTTSGGPFAPGFLAVVIVASGNFTITETLLPGWVNTDPGGGTLTKTVNIPADLPQDNTIRFGNLSLTPGTTVAVGISPTGAVPSVGGNITLTVSETNSGQLPLNNISVAVTSELAAPWNSFTLTKAGPNPTGTVFAGDAGTAGVLDIGETWTWTITVPIPANAGPGIKTYNFTAIGSGMTEDGRTITFPEFQTERGAATVQVSPPVLVPGLSPLGLGLLIAALGGVMGLFLFRRARHSKA